jgi:hypothetical protein
VNDILWFESFASSAALCVEELQEFLQRIGIGGVPQEGALPGYLDKALIPKLV